MLKCMRTKTTKCRVEQQEQLLFVRPEMRKDLTTGRRLMRNKWTELPMPQDVINRVHVLGRRSHATRNLVFQWSDGTSIQDDIDDGSDDGYQPESDDDSYDSDENYDSDSNDNNDSDDGNYVPDPLDIPIAGVIPEEPREQVEQEVEPEQNEVNQNGEQEEDEVVNNIPAVSEAKEEDDEEEDDSRETAGVQEKRPTNQLLVETVDQERVDNEMNEQYRTSTGTQKKTMRWHNMKS
jgi:hypothetical protein